MSISYSEIPADNLFPLFMTEFDNSNASKGGVMPWKNLIVGQALSTNEVNAGTLKLITSDEQADALYGAGSQIARMIRAFRKNAKNSELWALAVVDGTTKATGAIAIDFSNSAETAPKSGAIRLMIGGQSVVGNVVAGDTAAKVAKAIADAITANKQLPVTATASSDTVTVTAKNGGTCGNGIDIRYNHYQGQELPDGVIVDITGMSGGGSDTAYNDANLGNLIRGTWYNAIAVGSDDVENVAYVKDLLDERWTATVQQTGEEFFSLNGSSVTKAKKSVTFTGTPVASKAVKVSVNDNEVSYTTASTTLADEVAALAAAINTDDAAKLLVTASSSSGKLILQWKGEGAGDDMDIVVAVGESGLTAGDVTAETGTTVNSSTATLDGLCVRGNGVDSKVVCLPSLPKSPTPGFEIAAAVVGCVAPKALNDPANPLSNYDVAGVVAPRPEDREDLEGNNLLLKSGCACLVSADDGTVYLKRMVTTYKHNAAGTVDSSYRQLETIFTLSYLRWDWNNYMASKYQHAKLADDGNNFGAGQVVMTPSLGRAELLGRYKVWEEKGLVQNYKDFAENLVVQLDPDDPYAMQFLIPAHLIKQFFISKTKIQFD